MVIRAFPCQYCSCTVYYADDSSDATCRGCGFIYPIIKVKLNGEMIENVRRNNDERLVK